MLWVDTTIINAFVNIKTRVESWMNASMVKVRIVDTVKQ